MVYSVKKSTLRKSNFVKLLDIVYEKHSSEYFKSVDYSIKAKLSVIFKFQVLIKNDCKELEKVWATGFDFSTQGGKFTKIEPKNETFDKLETELMHDISNNIDIFSYLVVSFFDILSKYTTFLYDEEIKFQSFSKQRSWFIKNPEIDKSYANFLYRQLGWYDIFKDKRDSMTHKLAPLVIPERKFGMFSVLFCYNQMEDEKVNVEVFVDHIVKRISEFVEFYGNYFIKKFEK